MEPVRLFVSGKCVVLDSAQLFYCVSSAEELPIHGPCSPRALYWSSFSFNAVCLCYSTV